MDKIDSVSSRDSRSFSFDRYILENCCLGILITMATGVQLTFLDSFLTFPIAPRSYVSLCRGYRHQLCPRCQVDKNITTTNRVFPSVELSICDEAGGSLVEEVFGGHPHLRHVDKLPEYECKQHAE